MEKLIIEGGIPLRGSIKVSGSKNSALPILASTILWPGIYNFHNVPDIKDVRTMLELLKFLGSECSFKKNKVKINSIKINKHEAPYDLVKTMRASVLIWGSLLSRLNKAKISFPGGCAIGDRPIDQHLSGFQSIGYKTIVKSGYLKSIATNEIGGDFKFKMKSVTGTENLILASVLGTKKTILKNCALEPEVDDLITFLKSIGANIKKMGDSITISPVDSLKKQKKSYEIIPDRIEAGTFMYLGCLPQNKITIKNVDLGALKDVIKTVIKIGAKVEKSENKITVTAPKEIKKLNIETNPYPSFPTDLQAQLMSVLVLSGGTSKIKENVFPNRFIHVAEMRKLGAKIDVVKNTAKIIGVDTLAGAKMQASDLRASAGLVLSALCASGKSEIFRIYHLDRGYEAIDNKLKRIGAKIWRTKE
tara:strand:+ start:4796 stop:6052 length:1257 start_codon:yes stop_codon:yes gene_type:complete